MKLQLKTSICKAIDFFLVCNFRLEGITESTPVSERKFLSKILLNSLKRCCRFIIYFTLKLCFKLRCIHITPLTDTEGSVVVSLTSFPLRINDLWMVIYCMFNQTIKPGKVVLYLSKEEFQGEDHALPESLMMFKNKGLEINFVQNNLKSHNKYYYAFKEYSNRKVVTIDDDLLYCFDTIERLVKISNKHPDVVCSNRVAQVAFKGGSFDRYNAWRTLHKEHSPSHLNCALGYSAVLYPTSFKSSLFEDYHRILSLSPTADDLWLKGVEIVEGVKVANGSYCAHPLTIPFSQKKALRFSNAESEEPLNDKQLYALDNEFNLYQKVINSTCISIVE